MISCAAFDALLRETADEGLTPVRDAEFTRHLSSCPACMARYVGYARATEMARAAYDARDEARVPLPEERVRAILGAVRASASSASSDVA